MTTRGRYPLETLLRLREEIRRQREQALAFATTALEHADEELGRAVALLDAHRERLARARQLAFLEEAPSAAGRQAAGRFLSRLEAEASRFDSTAAAAAVAKRLRADEREAARRALAAAETELKVVERNREAWDEELRRQALARAEAELEDIVAARRGDQ